VVALAYEYFLCMAVIGRATEFALRNAPRVCVWAYYTQQKWRGERALAVLDRCVRRGDTVVDVGAHRGLFTYRLSKLVGAAGHVHAFEPNPFNLDILRSMWASDPTISLYACALSDRSGVAEFTIPTLNGARVDAMGSLSTQATRLAKTRARIDVQMARFDEVVPRERPIKFMKVDVEGHEQEVLRGSESVLSSHHPTLLVEIEQRHREQPIAETFAYLSSLGYTGWALFPDRPRPLGEFELERDQLAYLAPVFSPHALDERYVHDFLFTFER
jgi:FkbM family methyltransferase